MDLIGFRKLMAYSDALETVEGALPLALPHSKKRGLKQCLLTGNTKRTVTIDGTEYVIPDAYALLDNSGSTVTAYACKRKSDNATGYLNLTTGVFTASSFTAGNELPTPDANLGVKGVGHKTENLYNKDEARISTVAELLAITKPTAIAANVVTARTVGDVITFSNNCKAIAVPCSVGETFSWKHFGTVGTSRENYTEADADGKVLMARLSYPSAGLTYTTTQPNCAYLLIEWSIDESDIAQMVVVAGGTIPSSYIPYGYKIPILKAENCGCVDLGTLSWIHGYTAYGDNYFYVLISDLYQVSPGSAIGKVYNSKYTNLVSFNQLLAGTKPDKSCAAYLTVFVVKDTGYDDAALFKAAMSGVYLFYQRATDQSWAGVQTYNTYLANPLYKDKVGTYADIFKVIKGKVARNIGVKVFDGTENWAEYARISQCFYIGLADSRASQGTNLLCSHYQGKAQGTDKGVYIGATNIGSIQCGAFYFTDTDFADVTEWKAFVAAQYAAGTPVTVWYSLATETEETATGAEITAARGTTYIDAETEVKPSNAIVKYVK